MRELGRLQTFGRRIADLKREIRRIPFLDLTPVEKRQRITELEFRVLDQARRAMGRNPVDAEQ